MANLNPKRMIGEVARQKGIMREEVISSLETALVIAAEEKFGAKANLDAQYCEESGEIHLFRFWKVVAEVVNPSVEIRLIAARKRFDHNAKLGDEVAKRIDHQDLVHKTGQFFKYILVQKVEEAVQRKTRPENPVRRETKIEYRPCVPAEKCQDSVSDGELEVPCRQGKDYFPFQKAAIKFINERNAVLLADDMGLGKTITVIGAINLDKSLKKILIICPLSVKNVWKKELASWQVRSLSVGEVESGYCPARRYDIFIINYDVVHKYTNVLRSIDWDLVVLDEAHYIKSRQAQRTKAIVGFYHRGLRKWTVDPITARKKILLTGTPIMNRPAELWPLVNYLDKVNFGKYEDFVWNYCGENPNYLDDDQEPKGHSNLEGLNKLLRSTVMIRRRKEDVLKDLPPKLRVILEVPATTLEQKKAVQDFEAAWGPHRANITSLEERCRIAITAKDKFEYAAAVEKLQSAYKVAFFEMSRVRHEIGRQKAPLVVKHIEELLETGRKIVVFAYHRDVIQYITDNFEHAVSITGDTPVDERGRIVERFQNDDKTRLFVGNIKAAGTGITLHSSNIAVFAELDWVPANLDQAEDRLHRIGQPDSVLVHHIVFERSLDAHMARIIIDKQQIVRRALD